MTATFAPGWAVARQHRIEEARPAPLVRNAHDVLPPTDKNPSVHMDWYMLICKRTAGSTASGHEARASEAPGALPSGPAQAYLEKRPTSIAHTLGYLMHGFGAGQKSSIFGVWAAPAVPNIVFFYF